jgi:alanine dehydrogenase
VEHPDRDEDEDHTDHRRHGESISENEEWQHGGRGGFDECGDDRRARVSNSLVERMKPGSVLVDIAIDQGGCFEDSIPTTHADPTCRVHDSVFYCVANMPGAVPRTSTYALTNATLPHVVALADKGWEAACEADAGLKDGLGTHNGALLSEAVAAAFA